MTEDEITLLQKRVRIAEESKARAWANAGILERARQAQDKTIADLRERLAKAEARNVSMREALIWTQKQVELARIWGGMAWHWNPLLPIFTSAIHERITHELAALGKEGA